MKKKNLKYIRKQKRKQYGFTKVGVRDRGGGKKYYKITLPLQVAKQMKLKEGDFLVWQYDPLTHIWNVKLEEENIKLYKSEKAGDLELKKEKIKKKIKS